MIYVYQTVEDRLLCRDEIEEDCWINLVNPTEAELSQVAEATGIDYDFLKYPLDDEEIPRCEVEEDQSMIIIHAPIKTTDDVIYDTIPLGMVLNDRYVVTICLEDLDLLAELSGSRIKGMATFKKTRFVFQTLHRKTNLFLKYLRDINRRTEEMERVLSHSMKNKELLSLLNLQKSLVYFSTSLRYNAKVMNRLIRGRIVKMYEEDEDLLEDVIIENTQAIEMAEIYSNITNSTMSAFSSLISNTLSMTMKLLTAITIILSIPTMIASFWGMNVNVPFAANMGLFGFGVILGICAVACVIVFLLLKKKDMF
ncbi:MAG: magnesium transporter CorA family protein [Bacillota bacterium]|nr:magnesium transporter CorA family protein [Bacillota bacterium]